MGSATIPSRQNRRYLGVRLVAEVKGTPVADGKPPQTWRRLPKDLLFVNLESSREREGSKVERIALLRMIHIVKS
jgi:hypothetical protein